MADASIEVQVVFDEHHKKCVQALWEIAAIADTGSPVYGEVFKSYIAMGEIPSGWRVAEEMRQVAMETLEGR